MVLDVLVRGKASGAGPRQKITPGVGLIWYAGKGQGRSVLMALVVTIGIAAASFAISPTLWLDWVTRLRGDTQRAGDLYVSLIGVRLAVAAVIVLYGSWREGAWLIPVAVVIALPILWEDSLAILLACFPLFADEMRNRRQARTRSAIT